METLTNDTSYSDTSYSKVYVANDLNFQDCEEQILEYFCKYRIPIRSKYPKLVVDMFIKKTPRTNCLRDIRTQLSEAEIFDKIIESIDIWTNDTIDNMCTHISFFDKRLWCIVYKMFKITENHSFREKHENLVMQSVNTQLKHNV